MPCLNQCKTRHLGIIPEIWRFLTQRETTLRHVSTRKDRTKRVKGIQQATLLLEDWASSHFPNQSDRLYIKRRCHFLWVSEWLWDRWPLSSVRWIHIQMFPTNPPSFWVPAEVHECHSTKIEDSPDIEQAYSGRKSDFCLCGFWNSIFMYWN